MLVRKLDYGEILCVEYQPGKISLAGSCAFSGQGFVRKSRAPIQVEHDFCRGTSVLENCWTNLGGTLFGNPRGFTSMRRRRFLASSAVLPTAVAGCTDLLDSEADPTEGENNFEIHSPSVEWDETIVSGREYEITAEIDFDGVEEVRFELDDSTVIKNVTRTSEQTTVAIAGPDEDFGPLSPPDSISAYYLDDDDEEWLIGSHIVGSIIEPEAIPFHLTGLSGNTGPDLDNAGYADRVYQYSLNGQEFMLSVKIPDVLFKYYEARERMPNRGAYVADPYQSDYLAEIASQFKQVGESDSDVVNHAMSFVQQLEYTLDEVATGIQQYTYYPLETLNDAGGDCEDTAILLAGLLQEIGYGCVLLAFWDEQHMALGVAGEESIPGTSYEHDGTHYYYVETTAPGWRIGQVPVEIEGATPEIQDIKDHPTLVFGWNTRPSEQGGVEIETLVRNVGSVTAEEVQVHAEFEDRDGDVLAASQTTARQIAPDAVEEVTLEISPPADVELRGRTAVLLDGYLHDKAVTEWREPFDDFD